jgi:hypothetical protein
MHDLLRAYAASLAAAHDDDQARHAALTGLFGYYQAGYAAAVRCLAPAEPRHWNGPATAGAPVPEFRDPAAAWAWVDAELACLAAVAAYTASDSWPGPAVRLAPAIPQAWVVPPNGRPLRALLRRRLTLDQLGTELRNRVHAATSPEIVSDCMAVIDSLEPLISELDGELQQRAAADPRVRMLIALPGVAEFTALVMLAAIGDSTRSGDPREAAHRAGQTSASLRLACCQAAQLAQRSPAFAATYAAIAERRGKKIATVAIARKLLARACLLLAGSQAVEPPG